MTARRSYPIQVGVLGAGAMGSGIALVAAKAGHDVILADAESRALGTARESIGKTLARDEEKGRLGSGAAKQVESKIHYVAASKDATEFSGCGLVIEAIVEELDAKRLAFAMLEWAVDEGCVLATNTSSLSVAAIGAACRHPGRVIGLHFFNPAPVLPLVEVVGAISSDPAVVSNAAVMMDGWGKDAVTVRDTPGFIVNRVARPFYGEALRIQEEGIADIATIDWAMKELGGFRMGPFELMDLIGNDVNYAVTMSIFEAFYYDPRYRPSLTQRRMVEAGRLGRKSGIGYYDYGNGAKPPEHKSDRKLGGQIVDRILAMLINEAADAAYLRIASKEEIDTAMTKGVNYPKGLLAWGDEIGVREVYRRMVALHDECRDDRYRPSPLLRRHALSGERFYP